MADGSPRAGRRPGLRRTAAARGRAGLRRVVAGADDRRLERTLGTPTGLRLLFAAFAAGWRPERAPGLRGVVGVELVRTDGTRLPWTVTFGEAGASAAPGGAPAPPLTVTLAVADLVRLAAGELDAGTALLTGRLEPVGDAAMAMRLADAL